MKRRIIVEIDVPENFDTVWDEPSGIRAFHDTVIVGISELGIKKVIQYSNYEKSEVVSEKQFAKYLKTKHETTQSLEIVGWIDSDNKIHNYA